MAFQVITSVEEATKLCDAGLLWLVSGDYAMLAAPAWSEWWASGLHRQHVHDGLFCNC